MNWSGISRLLIIVNDPFSQPPTGESESYELEVEHGLWHRLATWIRSGKGAAITASVLLTVALMWNAKALYHGAKLWRAGRLITRAEKASIRGDVREQVRLLREAFVIAPATPLTLRATARFHESRGEPAALPLYERLLATPEATAEDSLRACRLALLFGRSEMCRKLLDDLHRNEETRNRPAVIAIEAQLLASDGKWEQALVLARKAVAAPASTSDEKFMLASLLVRAPTGAPADRSQMQAEAIDILATLIESTDDSGAQAISALVSIAREPNAAALLAGRNVTTWVDVAARHPKVTPRLRVLAWDLHVAAHPADIEKITAEFLVKWRDAPLPERLEAARWLNLRGRPMQSLELSGPQRGTSSDWLLVHLDSLAASGRWDTALEILENKSNQATAIPDALRALFSMRAKTELKKPQDRDEQWRDIQILLKNETVQNQLYVAQYAEKTGEAGQAALIFRRLLDRASSESTFAQSMSRDEKMACYSGVIRHSPENASAADLLPVFDALSEEFPELDEAANDASYLRLLTGGTSDTMRDRLQNLLQKAPAVLAYRTTLALCELRAGNAAAAEKVYKGWQIDWSTAPDRYKVVRAAVLKASGRDDEAKTLRATIDVKKLRPEEAKLMEALP